MVTRRAHGAERIARLAVGDGVDSGADPAHGAQSGLPRRGIYRRVRIEVDVALVGNVLEDGLHVERGMHPLDLPQRPLRRFVAVQEGELFRFQRRHDRAKPGRRLRMPFTHVVSQAHGMRIE